MSQRGAPGPVARSYAWAVLAVHPLIPVAWLAAVVLATLTLPSLGSAGSAPLEDLVAKDSQALAAQERSAELFGSPLATDTVVVLRDPQGLSRAELDRFATGAHDVARQRAGRDLAGLKAVVPAANVSVGPLRWREDGTTAIGYLAFEPSMNLLERRAVAQRWVERYARPGPEARAGVSGAGPARLAQYDAIVGALPLITIGSVLLIGLIVGLHFRSLSAPVVTLVAAAIAYGIAIRVLGWAGERADLAVPREVEPVLVVLLLGLVTDYAVFFLSAFRDALPGADSRYAAMRAATAATGRVVFTAGLIVAAGTAALVAGQLDFFRAFGPGLAVTALIAVAVCLTFLPACLALLGGRLVPDREAPTAGRSEPAPRTAGGNLPARLRFRFAGPASALGGASRAARAHGLPRWRVIAARIVTSRPVAVPVVIGCVAALLLGATGLRHLQLGVSLVPSLPASDPVREAGDDAMRGFTPGIAAPVEITLEQPGIGDRREALSKLEQALRHEPGVAVVAGPAEEPSGLGGEVTVTRDKAAARIAAVLDEEPGSADAIAIANRLEARLPALASAAGLEGASVAVGGETALGGDTVDAVVGDLWRIALVALLLNLLLLAIFMRALVAPLYLLAASVLGFAAGLGLTVLVFQGWLGYDGLTYYVPLATAVLLVSLGSDYNVFVAGRIWTEARTRRLREAVAVATPQAAGAITVAGITLAASFALLALVPVRAFREFALLMVIGVLIDALLVRSLLIPGLISLVGERSWWPGRRVDPPRAAEILAAVARRIGTDRAQADRVTRATLATLAERITRRESRNLCVQLPRSLNVAMHEVDDHAATFGPEEFAERVAERAGMEPGRAFGEARAVIAVLGDVVDETTMETVRGQLGEQYARLLSPEADQDVMAPDYLPEFELPRP
jgi:RND superfamily putative drug exporter